MLFIIALIALKKITLNTANYSTSIGEAGGVGGGIREKEAGHGWGLSGWGRLQTERGRKTRGREEEIHR